MVSGDQNANPDNQLKRTADEDLHRRTQVRAVALPGGAAFWTKSRLFAARRLNSLITLSKFMAG
jgi:hypothetical protein